MAEKRMFSKTIIDSDLFLDMPASSRLLYFDLNMRADDDGFVNAPKKIIRMTGASEDDLRLLIAKQFVIPFESGVVVIRHWKVHNYIQKDRYKPTMYQEEKSQLAVGDNKEYLVENQPCVQDVSKVDTQIRLDKVRLDKVSIDKNSIESEEEVETSPTPAKKKEPRHKYGEYKHVMLTDKQRDKLFKDYGMEETLKAIDYVDEYCEKTGKRYNNYNLVIRDWGFSYKYSSKSNRTNDRSNTDWSKV